MEEVIMTSEFWGGVLLVIVVGLLGGWLGITIVSNVTCKADKESCNDYLRCSHYGEHCDPNWGDAINFYLSNKKAEQRNIEKIKYIEKLKEEERLNTKL